MSDDQFFTAQEQALAAAFGTQGRLIAPVADLTGLERLRRHIALLTAQALALPAPDDPGAFLDGVHAHLPLEQLNNVRLTVIRSMNATPWLRPTLFRLARPLLEAVVGNELVMQRRINLSIQIPGDTSSLLPVHADVWSGDSPFEAVVWLPLVDCRRSKSMYLLPPDANRRLQGGFAQAAGSDAEAIFQAIAPSVEWIEIDYGQVMLFDQTLPHGNRVNQETSTRWSLNCRFKGAFTPYADKKLGEFFEPITLRPMSRIGLDYRFPGQAS